MAATRLMIAVCALVVALAAAGAAAQRSGNLAFLAPVHELPGLAKPGEHRKLITAVTTQDSFANVPAPQLLHWWGAQHAFMLNFRAGRRTGRPRPVAGRVLRR